MDVPGRIQPQDGDAEAIRLQAEEHPLIEDQPPTTPAEHCLRLMHLRAYDEAVAHAVGRESARPRDARPAAHCHSVSCVRPRPGSPERGSGRS